MFVFWVMTGRIGRNRRAPTATRIVDALESCGLVRRERTAADRRAVLVALTANGQRALRRKRQRPCPSAAPPVRTTRRERTTAGRTPAPVPRRADRGALTPRRRSRGGEASPAGGIVGPRARSATDYRSLPRVGHRQLRAAGAEPIQPRPRLSRARQAGEQITHTHAVCRGPQAQLPRPAYRCLASDVDESAGTSRKTALA
jgi:DNA-binding MarR family transcriptional regulator